MIQNHRIDPMRQCNRPTFRSRKRAFRGNRRVKGMLAAALLIAFAWCFLCVDTEAADTSAVKLTSVMGLRKNVVMVRAEVKKVVASKDNKYYLYSVKPKTLALQHRVAVMQGKKKRGEVVRFDLNLVDPKTGATHRERALYKYAIAIKNKKGKMVRVSDAKFVRKPERAAMYRQKYFVPKTKKGIQTGIASEAITTNSSTVFCNLYVSEIVSYANRPYRYAGKTYYFNDLSHYRYFCKYCNERNIQVTFQVMLDSTKKTRPLSVRGNKSPKNKQLAFNITKTNDRERIEAMFCYIAEMFSEQEHYVSNWIIGNEVEMCYDNYHMGHVKKSKFIDNYARTFRSLYNAVRSVRGSSKVYICMGQGWNMKEGGKTYFKSKGVVKSFAKKIKSIQSDVNWNLAQHPYPDRFHKPAFWKSDRSSMVTNSISSPKITMSNLHVLTKWIRAKYGKNTRILISEIGFDNSAGHRKAAAAMALAYDIVACDPQIDGIMYRSYEDASDEYVDGHHLKFGIKGRKAYKVYKYMDTKKWKTTTVSLLKTWVGKNWKKHVKRFKAARLYSIYRK